MEKLQSYLELNGKIVIFLCKDGIYWIALKPICEALSINYNAQYQNIKEHPILKAEYANQHIQVPGDQMRKMICLPEEFIYGWLFSIQSNSPELIEYHRKCYHILFTHFHGTLTERQALLNQRIAIKEEIDSLQTALSTNKNFTRLNELKAKNMRMENDLKKLDELLASGQTRMEF